MLISIVTNPILSNAAEFGFELGKSAALHTGSICAIGYITIAAESDPVVRLLHDPIGTLMAAVSIGYGLTSIAQTTFNSLSGRVSRKSIDWRNTAKAIEQIAYGATLLYHNRNPNVYTSILLGGHLLYTGLNRVYNGAQGIHTGLKTRQNGRFQWELIANGIIGCALGAFGGYASYYRITERLHHLQSLSPNLQALRDHPNTSSIVDQPQRSEYAFYRTRNDLVYDPEVQRDFAQYCTDTDMAMDQCAVKIEQFLEQFNIKRQLLPRTLEQLAVAKVTPKDFLQMTRDVCKLTHSNYDECYSDPTFLEKVSDLLFRQDDPGRTWQQRLVGLRSAFQLTWSSKQALLVEQSLRKYNAVVFLNSQDAEDALSGRGNGASLLSIANVYLDRVKDGEDGGICPILRDARQWAGQPLDLAQGEGHGNPASLSLTKTYNLNTVNAQDVAPCFKKTLAQGAPIVLHSCSTGGQRGNGLRNLAEILAGATGHPVDAATQSLRAMDCDYRVGRIGVVTRSNYRNEAELGADGSIRKRSGSSYSWSTVEALTLHCKKTQALADDDEGDRLGEYMTRFARKTDYTDEETIAFDRTWL